MRARTDPPDPRDRLGLRRAEAVLSVVPRFGLYVQLERTAAAPTPWTHRFARKPAGAVTGSSRSASPVIAVTRTAHRAVAPWRAPRHSGGAPPPPPEPRRPPRSSRSSTRVSRAREGSDFPPPGAALEVLRIDAGSARIARPSRGDGAAGRLTRSIATLRRARLTPIEERTVLARNWPALRFALKVTQSPDQPLSEQQRRPTEKTAEESGRQRKKMERSDRGRDSANRLCRELPCQV